MTAYQGRHRKPDLFATRIHTTYEPRHAAEERPRFVRITELLDPTDDGCGE